MQTHTFVHRWTVRTLMLAMLLVSVPVSAQSTPDPMLVLQPRCTEDDRTKCETFTVVDAQTLQTNPLQLNDILDIDVVLKTQTPENITAIRAWLQYDPTVLEARNVELTDALPLPSPGEVEIDPTRGQIKIAGGTNNALTENDVAIARVTFQVKSLRKPTEISFYDYKDDVQSGTAVFSELQGAATQILETEPATLQINIPVQGGNESSSSSLSSSVSSSSGSTQSSSVSSAPQTPSDPSAVFPSLQVQNVRVTSQQDQLFVGWDAMNSSEVAGYNIYYGTVSGRYIQRRSVPGTSNSLVVRSLEVGQQYFVAVRGFNAANQETAFSQEVSVVIGRPETSTAPLVPQDTTTVPENPIDTHDGTSVVGETGMSETVAIILAIAAIVGTGFAWRKHFTFEQ